MKESKFIRSLAVTLVAVVLSGPVAVLAATYSNLEDARVTVSYADLNLDTEQGVQTLYRRLQRASKDASGLTALSVVGSVQRVYDARRYYNELLSRSVANINNKRLSEIHAG